MKPDPVKHDVKIRCERPQYMPHGGFRASCSCGWWSDCYAQMSDTERAVEVHHRRVKRQEFEDLIARSSIGQGLRDIKERGIDAHLADLEREMSGWRRPRKSKRAGTATNKKVRR